MAMAGQLMTTPDVPSPSLICSLPADVFTAELESQATIQKGSEADDSLEPGEVPASVVKQENAHDSVSNTILEYRLVSNEPGASETGANVQFTRVYADRDRIELLATALSDMSRSRAAQLFPSCLQRRNHARLSEIVTRLQNFSGSVTQLLAIANVQQQIDTAFADLDRAKNQLKDVFRQFELQGHISNRQCHKKNGATKDLTKASQRIVQLTKELCDLQPDLLMNVFWVHREDLTATAEIPRTIVTSTNLKPLQRPRSEITSVVMCRVGTVIMNSPGCNHARQSGWQDSAVGTHLSDLITRCSSCKPDQSFCGKLTIDSGLNSHSSSSARRSGVPQPPSLASLIQPTPGAAPTKKTLDSKCKFCTLYESEIRLADHIKQTLTDYNMALLFDEARLAVKAQSKIRLRIVSQNYASSQPAKLYLLHLENAFQYAVDEAVRAYGIDGKGRDKALRTLDSEYQKASAEISRICGEKQLAPYRELYGLGEEYSKRIFLRHYGRENVVIDQRPNTFVKQNIQRLDQWGGFARKFWCINLGVDFMLLVLIANADSTNAMSPPRKHSTPATFCLDMYRAHNAWPAGYGKKITVYENQAALIDQNSSIEVGRFEYIALNTFALRESTLRSPILLTRADTEEL
ncbi:hypothetical protein CIB48_g12136 [Xylaria polymorpha]|nr:hypothetical protein CIB48_g12136 [Xylaria polymorpha]